MLKKLFSILMLLIYIPAIAGVGFSTHYCEGERGDTHVFSVSKHPCCCSPEQEETNDCCSDEIKVVKLEDNQQGQHRLLINTPDFDLIPVVTYIELPLAAVATSENHTEPDPPPLRFSSKNILYCCFRI